MKTKILNFDDFDDINSIINNDGVIAFPTETVYGLGIRSDSFLAYEKIFKVKKRDNSKALTLMLHNSSQISEYVDIDTKTKSVIDKFMPGALTLVLPLKNNINIIGCEKLIGIRVPDDKKIRTLLKKINLPLFVTSANISNEDARVKFDDVFIDFNGVIDGIIKGSVTGGVASTVISIVNNEIKLLRKGPINLEEIKEVYYS